MDNPMAIHSRDDLVSFIDHLAADLESNPAGWENDTLPKFLDALSRYLHDLPGWCLNNSPETNPETAQWSLIAVALSGAAVYE
ncbi:DUF7660 family protein [Zavarzinella formosa]|uniref:DUF7660 family protein n=1 Tax=Zavarzinella formosa TaxID=360055 RepID=UPI000306EAC4|nr:hypothetical protein [Zavarzinella formosa]